MLLVHQLRLQPGPGVVQDDEDVELGPHINERQLPEVGQAVGVPWFRHRVPQRPAPLLRHNTAAPGRLDGAGHQAWRGDASALERERDDAVGSWRCVVEIGKPVGHLQHLQPDSAVAGSVAGAGCTDVVGACAGAAVRLHVTGLGAAAGNVAGGSGSGGRPTTPPASASASAACTRR
eukprot:124249-Chlamydomonas_euryale.AAC.1